MNSIKYLLTALILSIASLSFAQSAPERQMRSFVPKSKAYDIYYPLDLWLQEDEDGIVTITDTLTDMNITVSTYHMDKKQKDGDVINMLTSFINEEYKKNHKADDWNSYDTKGKFDVLVELQTNFDGSNWVWYGVAKKKSLVIISINKENKITQDEIDLVMFMIDNMIIN